MTLPGTGKRYEQFRFDDYECRRDGLRKLLLPTDFAVLAMALGVLVLISAHIYPNIAR
ncbi:MAG TPA: hypothetical protein VEV21_01680 [Burkholderiales bacterium]|nr:hypothetical protein [Burkholderiales bacterium]